MKKDSRLSSLIHILIHMADKSSMTSDFLAHCMNTNPVVVRRLLAGLRTKGIVDSNRGPGGGWELKRKLEDITLKEVFLASGVVNIFAVANRLDNPKCLIEQEVNQFLDETFKEAEEMILRRMEGVSLRDLEKNFKYRLKIELNKKRKNE